MNIHELHDEYSRRAHCLIADKLRLNPHLIEAARDNLNKIAKELSPQSISFMEWEIILKCDVESICEFIIQKSDHLQELRQSSPFSGILTEEERRILRRDVYATHNLPDILIENTLGPESPDHLRLDNREQT
ncbi:hypothetical protein [Pseudomonas putida]